MRSHWPIADCASFPISLTGQGLSLACAQPSAEDPGWPCALLPAVLNDPTYINDTIRREHSPPA